MRLFWELLLLLPSVLSITILAPPSLTSVKVHTNSFSRHLGHENLTFVGSVTAPLSLHRWDEGCALGEEDRAAVEGTILVLSFFECDPATLLSR